MIVVFGDDVDGRQSFEKTVVPGTVGETPKPGCSRSC